MKKLLSVLLAVGIATLLAACGKSGPEPPAGGKGPAKEPGPEVPAVAGSGAAELLKALDSDDQAERLAAIDVIGQRGQEIEGAVPALIELLGDESAVVRAHAANALGQIGSVAKPAAKALADLVFDKEQDPVVRREAMEAYRDIRPGPEVSLPLFGKLFAEADDEVRIWVMHAMAEAGKAAVPGLIEALKDDRTAYWACLVLSEIGPDAAEAVPGLADLAKNHKQPDVCREAVLALAAIGPGAAATVPDLSAVLDDEDTLLDGPAVFALGSIGPKAKPAEEKIRKLADDENSPPFFRTVCLWALARMNPDDQDLVREVVPKLVEALKASEPRVRAAAARALVDLDPPPEIVRPVLQKAMDEASPEVLDEMLDALAGLGEKAVPRLAKALEVEQVRARAAAIIARIGPPAKAAVPALVKALADENPETRNEVLFALAAIGADAAEAVPAIQEALKGSDPKVCYAACYALGKIGPAAAAAKEDLVDRLADKDQFLCVASAWALCQIDPKSPETAAEVVPVLIKALEEPEPPTRLHAAEAMGLLGPLAADAEDALKKLQDDPDEGVRAAAAKALKALGQ